MSLQADARRAEVGAKLAALKAAPAQIIGRLQNLTAQFQAERAKIVADPDFGQAEIDEVDGIAVAAKTAIKDFVASW